MPSQPAPASSPFALLCYRVKVLSTGFALLLPAGFALLLLAGFVMSDHLIEEPHRHGHHNDFRARPRTRGPLPSESQTVYHIRACPVHAPGSSLPSQARSLLCSISFIFCARNIYPISSTLQFVKFFCSYRFKVRKYWLTQVYPAC